MIPSNTFVALSTIQHFEYNSMSEAPTKMLLLKPLIIYIHEGKQLLEESLILNKLQESSP